MNVMAVPSDLIRRVLHAVNAASSRVFSYANRVSQTPAEAKTSCVELIWLPGHVGEIESSDLTVACGWTGGCEINVRRAASADKEHSWSLLRQEQCPSSVIGCRHIRNEQLLAGH